jgi:hypothetical protein
MTAIVVDFAASTQKISQVVAASPCSDGYNWLECTNARIASVAWRRPALTAVTAKYRVVDIRLENVIDAKGY